MASVPKKKKISLIFRILCMFCVAQILFTIFFALRILNATLKPDEFIKSGGASALADRQREIAQVVGDLSNVDMQPAVEFSSSDDDKKPRTPKTILQKKQEMEEDMNRLIVYGNSNQHKNDEFPFLEKISIRPLATKISNITKKSTIYAKLGAFDQKMKHKNLETLQSNKNINLDNIRATNASIPVVHIYGKAAIGRYLWLHIIDGELQADTSYPGTLLGQKNVDNVHLIYREGPGLIPSNTIPGPSIDRLVLVLNGRTKEKIKVSKQWLDHISERAAPMKLIVVMLGNENCSNSWINQYIERGVIKAVFLTYDDPAVDNNIFFQWPLGVATYREFPQLSDKQIEGSQRNVTCTLSATLHNESQSRHKLALLLKPYQKKSICSVFLRDKWQPSENRTTMLHYVKSLLSADLALCPTGYNAETYRIYEAMETGTVPIIEDRRPPSATGCEKNVLRLLKEYDAPVFWVKTWYELQDIIDMEKRVRNKTDRRNRLRRWYAWFKSSMLQQLITLIKERLLK